MWFQMWWSVLLSSKHRNMILWQYFVSVWVRLFPRLHRTLYSKEPHRQCFHHDFFWQFYNSLCRNLPRRYVLPLTVDEQTPLDQNLITLHDCKATARKTQRGEVGSTGMRRGRHFLHLVVKRCTVQYITGCTGIRWRMRPIIMINATNLLPQILCNYPPSWKLLSARQWVRELQQIKLMCPLFTWIIRV